MEGPEEVLEGVGQFEANAVFAGTEAFDGQDTGFPADQALVLIVYHDQRDTVFAATELNAGVFAGPLGRNVHLFFQGDGARVKWITALVSSASTGRLVLEDKAVVQLHAAAASRHDMRTDGEISRDRHHLQLHAREVLKQRTSWTNALWTGVEDGGGFPARCRGNDVGSVQVWNSFAQKKPCAPPRIGH